MKEESHEGLVPFIFTFLKDIITNRSEIFIKRISNLIKKPAGGRSPFRGSGHRRVTEAMIAHLNLETVPKGLYMDNIPYTIYQVQFTR